MSKELEALERLRKGNASNSDITLIKQALKEYEELSKIEYKQNTINDFYSSTKEMIDDLLNLVSAKMCDFLKDGKTYTRASVLETLGSAIRYVKTFVYGLEFNKTEKIGVNTKKLKALEIIKETPIFAWYITIYKDAYEMIADAKGFRANESAEKLQEKFDLLKEVLL